MVSTRSNKTNYTFTPAENSKLVKSNTTPVFQYFIKLQGKEKSQQIKFGKYPLDRIALVFNWFLHYIVPLKKPDQEESFESLFTQIATSFYPNYVRIKFSKARQRKSEAILTFKKRLQTFYDQIYGPRRLFNIVPDTVLGHKVFVHQNMYESFGNKRTGRIPFHVISESLLGSLIVSPQSDILTDVNHNSMYEYNKVKYLLIGPLYFVPHHCDSMLSFDRPVKMHLYNVHVPTTKLYAEDPHAAQFRVGDEVSVNYHMGEQPSEYNFVCQCGSANCISLIK
jgi:hypothetical protein